MIGRFFDLLIRVNLPAPPYYWLLDRMTDNNGWRPLDLREASVIPPAVTPDRPSAKEQP